MRARSLAAALLLAPVACASLDLPYTLHFQSTFVDQGNYRFHSAFSGPDSLPSHQQSALSITSTLFSGVRVAPGTELFWDPEVTGGEGIGRGTGLAGFPNGEVFRVGNPKPVLSTARLFARETIGLGGGSEDVSGEANQIAGRQDGRRLVFIAGKFSLPDYFDGNRYSNDPRTQFLNWALMDSAAWDYPADTRGYTWGLLSEYHDGPWTARAAATALSQEANSLQLDRRHGRSNGFNAEADRDCELGGRPGTARLLLFLNQARMGSYDDALSASQPPDVTSTRAYGRTKYGFAANLDQELSDWTGVFGRLSWNDGRNETWSYTEVDRSLALGADLRGKRWGRAQDEAGAAAVVNGISARHREYLAAGGSGFMLGDGGLPYAPEYIAEVYYRFQLTRFMAISPDYQFFVDPGYNRQRGPVQVWAVRFHVQL